MLGRNGKQKNHTSSPNELFPSLDVVAIRKQLRLEALGLENGHVDSPDPDATDFDPVENEIIARVREDRRKGLNNASEHERIYQTRIIEFFDFGIEIMQISKSTETDFQREVDDWRNELKTARDDFNRSRVDVKQFKESHNLHREAHETGGLLKWLFFCSLLVVMESLLNGAFFAEASVAGLLGGVIIALVISIVNVGTASIAGHWFRQKNHIKLIRKTSGWIVIIFVIFVALFFNFLVGHFRDLTDTIPWNEAAGAAYGRVLSGQIQMQSLDAILLTGVGLLFAAISGWKAYTAYDPYPDYSRVSEKSRRKQYELQEKERQKNDDLIRTRDERVEDLKNAYNKIQKRYEEAASARTGLSSLAGRRREFLQECDHVVNDLLAVYREANRKARVKPEPDYFRRKFNFETEDDMIEPLPPNPETKQHLASHVDDAIERIHQACKNAMDAFSGDRNGHL